MNRLKFGAAGAILGFTAACGYYVPQQTSVLAQSKPEPAQELFAAPDPVVPAIIIDELAVGPTPAIQAPPAGVPFGGVGYSGIRPDLRSLVPVPPDIEQPGQSANAPYSPWVVPFVFAPKHGYGPHQYYEHYSTGFIPHGHEPLYEDGYVGGDY